MRTQDFAEIHEIGAPAMAVHLVGEGAWRDWGLGYQRIYQDVDARWGDRLVKRNDNGKVRLRTPLSRQRERESLVNDGSVRRFPIAAISHYSDPHHRRFGPWFSMLCTARDPLVHVSLNLPLEEDALAQAESLWQLVATWLPGFPLVSGTIGPAIQAFADFPSQELAVHDPGWRAARAAFPGFQCQPRPAMGGHLDGLANWSEITLIGGAALARAGGAEALARALPEGLACETVGAGGGAVVMVRVAAPVRSLASRPLAPADLDAYCRLAAFLKPWRSSIHERYVRPEEWDRLTVDWALPPEEPRTR